MKRIRKKLSLLLSLALLCQMVSISAFAAGHDCPGAKFVDMPSEQNWAHSFLDQALKEGIIVGTSENTISPNAICTRAQIYTMFWRAIGSPEPQKTHVIKDVSESAYYYKAACWAIEYDWPLSDRHGGWYSVVLDENGNFNPNRPCTRLDVVKILSARWGYVNKYIDIEPGFSVVFPVKEECPFKDITDQRKEFSYDEYEYVRAAYGTGWVSGTSATTFSPKQLCNRAQVVTFLLRYVALSKEQGLIY